MSVNDDMEWSEASGMEEERKECVWRDCDEEGEGEEGKCMRGEQWWEWRWEEGMFGDEGDGGGNGKNEWWKNE